MPGESKSERSTKWPGIEKYELESQSDIIKLNVFKAKKTEDYLAVPRNGDSTLTFSMITKENVLKE